MRGLMRATVAAAAATLALLVPEAAQAGGPPAIAWSPTTSGGTFDHGAIVVGETASQAFTLTNTGGSATARLSISLSGSEAFSITSDACTGTSIGKRKSCAVTVEYAPTTVGQSDTATLSASGKKAAARASITHIGSGAGTPDLTLSPGRLTETMPDGTKNYFFDFGSVLSTRTISQTFTVTNSGDGPTDRLVGRILSPKPLSAWAIANDTCGSLAPGGTCTFDIRLTGPAGCRSMPLTATLLLSDVSPKSYVTLTMASVCGLP